MAKIGIISDIHGNFEALTAVMPVLENASCDVVYCLGDVVGYGGSPVECLDLIRHSNIKCLLGNHDEYVSSFDDSGYAHLRDDVKKSISWTQSQLQFDDLDWLLRLPKQAQEFGCAFIHSSFAPRRWAYCLDEATFALNFKHQTVPLAFCGHSHFPALAVDVKPGELPFIDNIRDGMSVPDCGHVMINVGAVGQPRDRDPRACVAFYDTETRILNFVRVEYDVTAAQKKILAAGLPEIFATRLTFGR